MKSGKFLGFSSVAVLVLGASTAWAASVTNSTTVPAGFIFSKPLLSSAPNATNPCTKEGLDIKGNIVATQTITPTTDTVGANFATATLQGKTSGTAYHLIGYKEIKNGVPGPYQKTSTISETDPLNSSQTHQAQAYFTDPTGKTIFGLPTTLTIKYTSSGISGIPNGAFGAGGTCGAPS